MESQSSTTGLIMISKLYAEGKINDEDRERLKDMVFNEDAILLSLFSVYEDENDLKAAVLKYCQGGAMEMNRPGVIDSTQNDASELDQATSPADSALEMKKKKRMNQLAAAKEKERKQAEANGGVLGISDCDLGASPQMTKGNMFAKKQVPSGKMSPLGVYARHFQQNQQ